MTANLCAHCDRPTPDGTCCTTCGITRPTHQLQAIADMTPAARDIAQGQARHTTGPTTGKPGSAIPLDLAATQRLDTVQATLTTWARHIAETRGVPTP